MRLAITHTTTYEYDGPVTLGYSEARLTPRTTARQRCRWSTLDLDPPADDRRSRTDHFGNAVEFFALQRPHERLVVTARSEVDLDPEPTEDVLGAPVAWEAVRDQVATATAPDLLEARSLVLPSPLVPPDPAAAAFAAASFRPGRPLVEAVLDLSRRIRAELAYEPGTTTIATPLHEVLEHRRGVCQDFAHLAIAGLRAHGLPARYVSGYLETEAPPGQPKLAGADASHAWASVFVPGHGWLDIDPTNDVVIGERHVVTAWGRDYGDVTPLKGIVYAAGGAHRLQVAVDVSRVPEQPEPGQGR